MSAKLSSATDIPSSEPKVNRAQTPQICAIAM